MTVESCPTGERSATQHGTSGGEESRGLIANSIIRGSDGHAWHDQPSSHQRSIDPMDQELAGRRVGWLGAIACTISHWPGQRAGWPNGNRTLLYLTFVRRIPAPFAYNWFHVLRLSADRRAMKNVFTRLPRTEPRRKRLYRQRACQHASGGSSREVRTRRPTHLSAAADTADRVGGPSPPLSHPPGAAR